MNCKCCQQVLGSQREKSGLMPDYCDPICFAAGTTLTPHALTLWREQSRFLSMTPPLARAASFSGVSS